MTIVTRRQLISRSDCENRLKRVFPPDAVEDRVVAGPLAAAAAFTFVYAGAIDGKNPIRPSAILWMSDGAAARTDPEFRRGWASAARGGRARLEEFLSTQGVDDRRWYRENSRETLRDEVFRGWRTYGAISRDASIPTTSSRPAWTLHSDFALLFSPGLSGDRLTSAISEWQAAHLDKVALARQALVERRSQARQSVDVVMPDGSQRRLRPGDSSLLVKGVIEQLAPRLLGEPAVILVSESARKVSYVDRDLLDEVGIDLDSATLLPDAILMDLAANDAPLWFVEAVATDGEIHPRRKAELEALAGRAGWAPQHVRHLTAFLSRADDAWRRRTSRIAPGTCVWFLSEPDLLVRMEMLE